VNDRRRADLARFLGKFEAESLSEVELADKAAKLYDTKRSSRKYALLIADLIEEYYPDSIDIRDSRRGWVDPNGRDEL